MYKLIENALTNEDVEWFARVNKISSEKISRDVIEIEGAERVIIVKGVYIHGCVRDCGNSYLVPRYSRYDRIIKKNWKIECDVL